MKKLYETSVALPIGTVRLVASDEGLSAVIFANHAENKIKLPEEEPVKRKTAILAQAEEQLREYFRGERREFDVPLDPLGGTIFQKRVWKSLLRIRYGTTITYGYQAEVFLKDKNSVRAVALANSKNPLSIFVPCHRVIARNGKLQGYAGGLDVKQKLLALENTV